MNVRHPLWLAIAASSPMIHAATIDFETPAFATATPLSPAPATNILTDRPFDGQGGWSRSTSAATGTVFAAPVSGLHSAGQAIRGGASTYIGAKAGYTLVDPVTKQFTFDLQHGNTTESMVGLWNDDDGDGLFDQAEGQIQFGVMNAGSPRHFGYRVKGFGAQISSGTGGVSGHWYRCLVTIGDPDETTGDRVVIMRVLNLTTGSEVDFDTGTFGEQPWTVTIPSASFGVAPADAEGVFVRVTGSSAVDNINGPAPVFPPPASGWDGEADPDAKWSTATNWSGDVLPLPGNRLVFGSSSVTSPDNDLAAGIAYGGLEFTSAAPGYVLTGNRIALSGTVQNLTASTPQTISLPIELSGACTFAGAGQINLGGVFSGSGSILKSGTHVLQLDAADLLPDAGSFTMSAGTFDLGAFNDKVGDFIANGAVATTVNGAGGAVLSADSFQIQNTAGTVSLNAILGGGGALMKTGAGTLSLANANSYSGGTTINQGIVTAANNAAFGSGMVHLGSAGIASRIQLGNGLDIGSDITTHAQAGVTGRGVIEVTGTNSATWSGDITIEGAPTAGGTVFTDANASLAITGAINGGYFSQRAGRVTYSGGGTASSTSLSGTATLGGHNGVPAAGTMMLGQSAITTLDLAGYNQATAGLLSGNNNATVTNNGGAPSFLTLAPTADCVYSRAIEDGNALVAIVKEGAARQTLSGLNTYSGSTTVSAGTLAGSGASGSAFGVQGGGTLAPGAGIGTLITASTSFAGGSALEIEIAAWDGSTPGVDWDLLDAGALNLGATPASELTIKLVPSALQNFSEANRSFHIISGASAVTGFDPAAITVDASALPTTGTWAVQLDGTGTGLDLVYTAGAGSTYNSWAFTNAGGQGPDLDYDHDGVPNAVEYFMGASGSSFTTNPGIAVGKIIWPKSPSAVASYVVEISTNLKAEVSPGDGGWAPATTGVVDTGTTVEYTVPTGNLRHFVRLKVTTP